MDQPIVLTGGTGALGRAVLARLIEHGTEARIVSRRPQGANLGNHQWATADLTTGDGLTGALTGARVVIHCATANRGSKDRRQAETLVHAARRAGCDHIVYVSIVGVDRVPISYYRGKLAAETVFERSNVASTILRVTQFHDLVRVMLAGASIAPLMVIPGCSFQPVDVRDVAVRLVELATSEPIGRAPDMGGPQALSAPELADIYLRMVRRRRAVVTLRLPGQVGRALRDGANLATDHRAGVVTFEDYLAEYPRPTALAYRLAPS